jgi:hypothetical protein
MDFNKWKQGFDRLLKANGIYGLFHNAVALLGFVLGGSVVISFIAWLEGTVGLAGLILLVFISIIIISCSIIALLTLSQKWQATKTKDNFITLKAAGSILSRRDVIEGANEAVQLALNDGVKIYASKILGRPIRSPSTPSSLYTYLAEVEFDKELLKSSTAFIDENDSVDCAVFGNIQLKDTRTADEYGNVRISLLDLTKAICG